MTDPDADPVEVARAILLRALSERARTRSELATLLAKRNVPDEAAEEILDRFADVGLIDDAAFASAWVNSRQQRKHLSRRALRAELQRKGVGRDEMDEALAEVSHDDEYEAALSLARQRMARLAGLERDVQYRRLAGVLGRKGFSGSIVSSVLRQVLDVDEDG